MPFCLFCSNPLDETTAPEHILLNALGGRKKTPTAICSACNNKFGGTIDTALTSQVKVLRNLLQLESGTGKPAPALKNVQAGKLKINIKGDGELALVAKPFTIEQLGEGQWRVQVQAGSKEQLSEIVPHIAAALKIPEERLREQIAAAQGSIVSQRPAAIYQQIVFDGPDALRSMVKASLVLWSTLVGNDEIRSAPYHAARDFVVNGDEQFLLKQTHLDSRFFVDVERMKFAFGPIFNLIYVRSDQAGRVIGHFTLYNAVAWQFTLAETGAAPNAKIGLISNPLNPSQWSDRAAEGFDVPFEWLSSPDYSDEMVRSKARLEAIMQLYVDTSYPKARIRIIEECFRKLDLTPDEAVPPEKWVELSQLIARRITNHTFSLREEEPISSETIADMIRKT